MKDHAGLFPGKLGGNLGQRVLGLGFGSRFKVKGVGYVPTFHLP